MKPLSSRQHRCDARVHTNDVSKPPLSCGGFVRVFRCTEAGLARDSAVAHGRSTLMPIRLPIQRIPGSGCGPMPPVLPPPRAPAPRRPESRGPHRAPLRGAPGDVRCACNRTNACLRRFTLPSSVPCLKKLLGGKVTHMPISSVRPNAKFDLLKPGGLFYLPRRRRRTSAAAAAGAIPIDSLGGIPSLLSGLLWSVADGPASLTAASAARGAAASSGLRAPTASSAASGWTSSTCECNIDQPLRR